MKPKVLIASLLPLLSAIASMGSHHTHRNGRLSNQITAPPRYGKCEDYKDISSWTAEQLKLYAQLRNFQTDLGTLLSSLNGPTPLKKCCFFEETTLKLIIKNVNEIDQEIGIQNKHLEQSGDLGEDLDNILPKIKKAVLKGFKSCCENVRDSIKKLKADLEEKVKNMERKLTEVEPESSRQNNEMQNILKDLMDKMKVLKTHWETMEKQLSNQGTNTQCFAELKENVLELDNKLITTKSKADYYIQNIENQLKELGERQRNQYVLMTALKKNTEDRGENIKNMLDKCKENCGTENDFDRITPDLVAVEKQLESLGTIIKNRFILGPSFYLNASLHTCLENKEKLDDIQSQLQELQTEKNKTCLKSASSRTNEAFNDISISKANCSIDENLSFRIWELQEDDFSLREKLEKFPNCCSKMDDLDLQTDLLPALLKEMNQTYNNHIKESAYHFKTIGEGLDETLKGMGGLNKLKNDDSLQEQLTDLNKKLDKAKTTLETLKDKEDGFFNHKDGYKTLPNSADELVSLKRNFEELRVNVDRQLKDFEGRQLNSRTDDGKELLEKLSIEVSQNLDKIKRRLLGPGSLAKLIRDQIAEQKEQAAIMLDCQKRCTKLNKLNDLIDRIEDLEKIVLRKKLTTKRNLKL